MQREKPVRIVVDFMQQSVRSENIYFFIHFQGD